MFTAAIAFPVSDSTCSCGNGKMSALSPLSGSDTDDNALLSNHNRCNDDRPTNVSTCTASSPLPVNDRFRSNDSVEKMPPCSDADVS